MGKRAFETFKGPKSFCKCGHTAEGEGSQHYDTVQIHDGHGPCNVEGCLCEKFTWAGWRKEFLLELER